MTGTRAGSASWPLDWLGAAGVALALLAFALVRIESADINWHLATARLAAETGRWPTHNTFSWTYPEHPLYQQYPVFQWLVWQAHRLGGFGGLSILVAAGWSLVFLLFVAWGQSWRRAVALHLLWMFALLALQRRMILRPDLLSMVWLGAGLLVLDQHLKGRRRVWLLLPLIQVAWANSHQLFPLFVLVQGVALGHLVLARLDPPGMAIRKPVPAAWPIGLSMVLSLGAFFATPLGSRVTALFGQTAESLTRHRHHVEEFAYIWTQPVEAVVALLCGVPAAVALVVSIRRRTWSPLEIGLWLLFLGLSLWTVRGLVFFGPLSIAIVTRIRGRLAGRRDELSMGRGPLRLLRVAALFVSLLISAAAVQYRWITPVILPEAPQPGVGRTDGDWPDAALAFLERARPPGRMMNFPWSNSASMWFRPDIPVFVDPRFESYPRPFLLGNIEAMTDDGALDGLLDEWDPDWVFALHCRPDVRARLAHLLQGGRFVPVYADPISLVLVRRGPATGEYLARHALERLPERPPSLHARWPEIQAHHERCWRDLAEALSASM